MRIPLKPLQAHDLGALTTDDGLKREGLVGKVGRRYAVLVSNVPVLDDQGFARPATAPFRIENVDHQDSSRPEMMEDIGGKGLLVFPCQKVAIRVLPREGHPE